MIIEFWSNRFAAAQRSTFTIPEDYTIEDIGNAFGETLEETDDGAQTADYTRG